MARLLPIEEIQTGMYVLSRHERSDMAPLAFSLVSETYVRLASNLVQLATATSASGSRGTLTVTEEHPFWVASSNGRKFAPAEPTASGATHTKVYAGTNTATTSRVSQGWAFAGDLQTGHVLSTPDCTESVTVANNVRLSNGPTTVYNFAVEGTATYFVSPPDAPDQCIWVHNAKKYGSKGKPDHQRKVKELVKELENDDTPGKVLQEKKVQGVPGCNRRPDAQKVNNGKTVKIKEAERHPNRKRNKDREAEYDEHGIPHETHKVGE